MMTPNKAVNATKSVGGHTLSVLEKLHTLDFVAQVTMHPTHSILIAMLIAPFAKYALLIAIGAVIGFLCAIVRQKRRSAASAAEGKVVISEPEDNASAATDITPVRKPASDSIAAAFPVEFERVHPAASKNGMTTVRRVRYYELYEETTSDSSRDRRSA